MPKDSLVDEAAKVPSRIFEGIVEGIIEGIKSQFGSSSSPSSDSRSTHDDDRDSGGGLFCNVPSHQR